MKFTRLNIKTEGHVLKISLDRPDQRNAFDQQMIKEITFAFENIGRRNSERVVLLIGNGPSFCAGADLAWMKNSAKLSVAQNKKEATELFNMFMAVKSCELPVVVKVHGHCMGGGLGLLAASDIGFAETNTQFSFSEVRLGLVPAVISSFVLGKGIQSQVSPLMLTGRLFQSEEAQSAGLLNYFGRELELNDRIDQTLIAFANAGPEAVRKTKSLIQQVSGQPQSKIKKLCIDTIAKVRVGGEAQEGLKSFFEKRTPKWAVKNES